MTARWCSLTLTFLLLGCQSAPSADGLGGRSMVGVFDGHSDVGIHYLRASPPWSLSAHDISRGLPGQSDIPRWRAGGMYGALITVASDRNPRAGGHFPRLLASMDWLESLARRHPQDLALVRSLEALRAARRDGRIALMAAIEGGDQIDGSMDNLRRAYSRGVRSMLIVYDHHNALGDGAMVLESSAVHAGAAQGGLSPLGRRLIEEMNRLGMIVDLSHASEETAHQALAVSRAPVIFSHSAARALAETPRNLSDETLERLRENGGIVMVPLAPYLIATSHWRWWSSGERRYAELVAAHPGDEAVVARAMAEWDRTNPQPVVTVADVADQIEHVARIAGFDHVGIGTDFDGMGQFSISGVAHAGEVQSIFAELARRGWSPAQLAGLGGANFERVLGRVEAAATR